MKAEPSRDVVRNVHGDAFLLLAALYFLYDARGPGAAAALFALLTHAVVLGRRRVALLPLYLALLGVGAGVVAGGLPTPRGAAGAAALLLRRCALALGLALAAALDCWALPLPTCATPVQPSGPCATAAQLVIALEEFGASCSVRVYYPAAPPAPGAPLPRALPFARHGQGLAEGLARFKPSLPVATFAWLRWLPSWCVQGDAASAPLALEAGCAAAEAAGLLPPGGARARRLPVVVFSHGLSASPDLYANSIAELVSHGCCVVAPEHADGSAAIATLPALPPPGTLLYQPLSPEEKTDRALEYARRHSQVNKRAGELSACLQLVQALAGRRRSSGSGSGSARDGGTGTLLHVLGGRVEATVLAAMGHSFGGASALALGARLEGGLGGGASSSGGGGGGAPPPPPRALVGLDAWAFPLSPHTLAGGLPALPVLALQGQGFARWGENAVAMSLLLDAQFRGAHAGSLGARAREGLACNGVDKAGRLVAGMGAVDGEAGAWRGVALGGGGGGSARGARAAAPSSSASGGAGALGSPLGSVAAAPREAQGAAPRVHPLSCLLALRDTFHYSFCDLGTLAPVVIRGMGSIGSSRSAGGEVALVRRVVLDFLRRVRAGGAGGFDTAAYAAAGELFEAPSALESDGL